MTTQVYPNLPRSTKPIFYTRRCKNKQRGACTGLMGMWGFVYELLSQKNLQISTLSREQNMRPQRITCLYIGLIHFYKCSDIEFGT